METLPEMPLWIAVCEIQVAERAQEDLLPGTEGSLQCIVTPPAALQTVLYRWRQEAANIAMRSRPPIVRRASNV